MFILLVILYTFASLKHLLILKVTIMKVYAVTSYNANLMGLFSTLEQAEACMSYYESRLPKSKFEIHSCFVDRLKF